MALHFTWTLSSGGASCELADGISAKSFTFDYLTDALADLLFGMTALYGPWRTERFFFDAVSTEIRWVLGHPDETTVVLSVYLLEDLAVSLGLPDSAGELAWRSTHPRAELTHAVLRAAEGVLERHGEDGYRELWQEHPFPMAALQDLRRLHTTHDACAGHPAPARPVRPSAPRTSPP
ncbi:hypothetical protein ACFYRY_09925 [Streptomyces sp. NPDC005263]|uniref:hypothetical protein n=1 Tax=Streptomyces sp. NPDC005263 TaxID=3364711 RepID=UPI00368D5489